MMHHRAACPQLAGLAILVLAVVAGPGSIALSRAAEAPSQDDTARDALVGLGRTPWYDAQSDSLKPIALPERRERQPANASPGGLLDFSFLSWTALAMVIVATLVMAYFLLRNFSSRTASHEAESATVSRRAAVEALPFMAGRKGDDLLGQARRYYEQGDFNEAIVYLFSYQLVQLDRFAHVRLARGKTNRQYVREAARVEALKRLLERTMVAFESVFFGGYQLDRGAFEACWGELTEFENLVARGAA